MNRRLAWMIPLCAAGLAAGVAHAQNEDDGGMPAVNWVDGPGVAKLGDRAEIKVPDGYRCADGEGTIRLLQAMQNFPSGNEVGLLGPVDLDWFIVFEYDDVGYVKDDDKDSLDADGMLKSIREGNAEGNKERKKRGWPAMNIIGWEQPPRYDAQTQNLVWAIRAESEGVPNVNYNTRRLGRTGVMIITLVCGPEQLPTVVGELNKLMGGFDFVGGQRYAEYRAGDKVAKYGLAALVTGGAAAVAVKSGAFKYLWKLIVAGVVIVGAFLKRIFGGRSE